MDILQQLDSGTSGLKYFVQSYRDDYSIKGDLGRERYVRMLDVLHKTLADEERVQNYLEYKKTNKLENYGVGIEYTKDKVYGDIKELEFLKDFLDNGVANQNDYSVLTNGLEDAIELYAHVFNNWDIYEDLINKRLTPAKEEPEVEEFAYEDLIESGVNPSYTDDEDSLEEVQQPTSRVERRRKRRTGR